MRSLGLVDGKIVDLAENVVPMEDRGHQFGDGIYEVTRVYNKQCFALKMHMDRMYRSLRELRIPAVYTYDELISFHELLIQESGIVDGAVYLQITRGAAPRTHAFPEQIVPRLTMSIRPGGARKTELWENGAQIIVIPDERWLRCDIKSLNLLGNILGKQKAKEAGAFEAVLVRDGQVTEGTSSNVLAVKAGVVWTHPTNNLILKGITRTIVVEQLAPKLDIPVIEKPFSAEFLKDADEVFLLGTSTEVMPIVSIDGKSVKSGKPGEITQKIQQAYQELIDEECHRA
ncbi:MAG: D-amino-acid transaminase [Pelosinus sp.]|nr:D-amino-acid transaminase [Pelosinus sp.]